MTSITSAQDRPVAALRTRGDNRARGGAPNHLISAGATPSETTAGTPQRNDPAGHARTVTLRIRRQDHPRSLPYWEQFRVRVSSGENVVSMLRKLRLDPVTSDGRRVGPVAFEHNCMEEVCGACAMLIDGRPRPSCSTLLSELGDLIQLEPLPKFPVVRDLMVDRARLFENLKRVRAWVRLDGAYDTHERAPRMSQKQWAADYLFSRCINCGVCAAACPQFPDGAGALEPQADGFVGPAALAQVRLLNAHPLGGYDKPDRLHAIMAEGGLSDCGNAQNCVRVCPKQIPLTSAIGELGRQTTVQVVKDLFGG